MYIFNIETLQLKAIVNTVEGIMVYHYLILPSYSNFPDERKEDSKRRASWNIYIICT